MQCGQEIHSDGPVFAYLHLEASAEGLRTSKPVGIVVGVGGGRVGHGGGAGGGTAAALLRLHGVTLELLYDIHCFDFYSASIGA